MGGEIIPNLGISGPNSIIKVKTLESVPDFKDTVYLLEATDNVEIHVSLDDKKGYKKVSLAGNLQGVKDSIQTALTAKNGLTAADIQTAVDTAVTTSNGLTLTEAEAAITAYLATAGDINVKVEAYISTFKGDLVTVAQMQAAITKAINDTQGVTVTERIQIVNDLIDTYTLSTVKLQTIKNQILAAANDMTNYTSSAQFNYDLEFHRLTAPGHNHVHNKGTWTKDEYPAPMVLDYSILYAATGQTITGIKVDPTLNVPSTDPVAMDLINMWKAMHPTLNMAKMLPFYILKIVINDPISKAGSTYPTRVFCNNITGSQSYGISFWLYNPADHVEWTHVDKPSTPHTPGYAYVPFYTFPNPAINDTLYLAVPYIASNGGYLSRETHIGPQ